MGRQQLLMNAAASTCSFFAVINNLKWLFIIMIISSVIASSLLSQKSRTKVVAIVTDIQELSDTDATFPPSKQRLIEPVRYEIQYVSGGVQYKKEIVISSQAAALGQVDIYIDETNPTDVRLDNGSKKAGYFFLMIAIICLTLMIIISLLAYYHPKFVCGVATVSNILSYFNNNNNRN